MSKKDNMEKIVASCWFRGDFSAELVEELCQENYLIFSNIEAEYGRQYEEMERLSHG